jgi:hypothetical protein
MRALQAWRRGQHLAQGVRQYAAEVALAEESPFLRFATPAPLPYNFVPALSGLPETKVNNFVGWGWWGFVGLYMQES